MSPAKEDKLRKFLVDRLAEGKFVEMRNHVRQHGGLKAETKRQLQCFINEADTKQFIDCVKLETIISKPNRKRRTKKYAGRTRRKTPIKLFTAPKNAALARELKGSTVTIGLGVESSFKQYRVMAHEVMTSPHDRKEHLKWKKSRSILYVPGWSLSSTNT
jgi:hypothetical protein